MSGNKKAEESKRIQIREEEDNPLFGRKEITAVLESEVTPSKSQAAEEIANAYSVETEAVKILKVDNHFGAPQVEITSHVYNSKEEKEKYEIKEKKEKEAEEAKQQAEQQAQETQEQSQESGESSGDSGSSEGQEEQSQESQGEQSNQQEESKQGQEESGEQEKQE